MKKNLINLLFVLFAMLSVRLGAYWSSESGDDWDFDNNNAIDCVTLLKQEIEESEELKHMFGFETHCDHTVHAIIEHFKKIDLLHNEQRRACDYDDFMKTPNLFSSPKTDPARLFRINVCGGAHVFLVAKRSDRFVLLQAWHKQFTLLQWLGLVQEPWQDKTCHDEFLLYGKGQTITEEQLRVFIYNMVKICRSKLERFREFGLGIPFELDITMWTLA